MEDKDSVIAHLRREIKAKDNDIYLAATYGKQLFDEKTQLVLKVEELVSQKELLKQEKYSLQLDLEREIKAVKSQTSDLEFQRDRADNLLEKFEISKKENESLRKKIENIRKENQCLKKMQNEVQLENQSLTDKISLLLKQIRNFEDQAEKSLCEAEKDENQELQAQLNTYMLNNKELQEGFSQTQYELEITKKNENRLHQIIEELENCISDRNAEISTYCAEVKLAKEEIDDLRAEIEALKFDQVDVNRRGNSVFAELDDRRNLVEREYKLLRKKFEDFQKNYEENKKELDRVRGQIAVLQSVASRDYQQIYIDKLEGFLSSARKEISDLTHKLSKIVKSNTEANEERNIPEKNQYDYLRVMLKQSQKKVKELQTEVVNLKTKSMYSNDKLIESEYLLYKAKEDVDFAKQEIVQLKLKIKDLEQGIIQNLPIVTKKPNVELLEGYKPLSANEHNKKADNLNATCFNDLNIIPGELELCEDGFKQVKPPRKSNRFILQQFNRIDPDDEDIKDSAKSTNKTNESVPETINKETVVDEKEKVKFKHVRDLPNISSHRNNDNCGQQ